jgi:hypothetical protein
MDGSLRNKLWSLLQVYYWDNIRTVGRVYPSQHLKCRENTGLFTLCRLLWFELYKEPIDTLPSEWGPALEEIRGRFFDCRWNEVYDFIEFVANHYPDDQRNKEFTDECNLTFQQEVGGFRFVDGLIAPIVSEVEIEAIEKAAASPYEAINRHLRQALALFADRVQPDWRNSIKESISAVEAWARIITQNPKATLGEALKEIEQPPLHPAFKSALSALYGYTSDQGGIRHSLLEEDAADSCTAKFMLVLCSAFVNYALERRAGSGE